MVAAARRRERRIRNIAGLTHRYAGLATALFLLIAGLTGSVIAFGDELDVWLNPDLFNVPAHGEPLAPTVLAKRVENENPHILVRVLPLHVEPGHTLAMDVYPRVDGKEGTLFHVGYDQIFVDPYTGKIVGRRKTGTGIDRRHLVETLTELHSSLLAGLWGRAFMGGIACIWVVNCVLGLYLTVPSASPRLRRWPSAWRIRSRLGLFSFSYDFHRAVSLWFWGLLLILAISSVYLNLNQQVFRPVVSLFSRLTPSLAEQARPRLRSKPADPVLSFEDALRSARDEAAARRKNLVPTDLFWLPPYGVYGVAMSPPGDGKETGLGPTRYFFDDRDGHLITTYVPGTGTAGDLFLQLQFPMHSGEIAGLPGRIVVSVTGLVTALISIAGVAIWWMKRRRRIQPHRTDVADI